MYVSKHLTPDLETETGPKYLFEGFFFGTEHVEFRLPVGDIDQGRFDIHSRPSSFLEPTEIHGIFRENDTRCFGNFVPHDS